MMYGERSPRHRTWKVRAWSRPPEIPDGEPMPKVCECGLEAWVPTAGDPGCTILAVFPTGGIVFDRPTHQPPAYWMPAEIECRNCGRIYVDRPAPAAIPSPEPEAPADVR